MSVKKFLLIGLAIVALVAGLLAANFLTTATSAQLTAGTRLQQPRELPDFQLTDENNAPVHKKDWIGHWTLVFPGFSYCPDVCPATLGYLKQLSAALGPQGSQLKIVFFSVDPERDTPERLKQYIRFFSPSFSAVTAREPQLGEFAKALSIAYAKVPSKTPDTYTMDHSAALILLDPQARITAFFSPPFQLDPMTRDLKAVMGEKQ
jgi:protein SCO1/2